MQLSALAGKSDKEKGLEKFARIGLTAKGIVYCLVAILTIMAAFGKSEHKGDSKEAFKFLKEQAFGQVMLVIIGVGLLGYVTLRFFQAIKDTEDKGKNMKGLFRRLGYLISGLVYVGFSIYAFKTAFAGDSGGGDSKKEFTARVLELPGGGILIGLIALIIMGQGIYQVYRGISKKFMKKVKLYDSNFEGTFKRIGMIGLAARGVVICMVGYFLLKAAINSNAKEAEGTGGALDFLQENFGDVLLIIVSLGLLLYGIFMFVRAKHERIRFRV